MMGPRTQPPFGADVASVAITSLAAQIQMTCAATLNSGLRRSVLRHGQCYLPAISRHLDSN